MPFINLGVALILVALTAWLVNVQIPVQEKFRVIINVVLSLIVVGVLMWLVNTYVPMAESIKAIMNIVVVVATCVYVLQAVGLWDRTVALWRNMRHRAARAAETPKEQPTVTTPSPATPPVTTPSEGKRAA